MFGTYKNLIKGPILAARTLIYAKMTQDGMKRGNDSIKKGNILKQYNEVAEEISKLQNMLDQASENESIDISSLMDEEFNKDFGYSLNERKRKLNQVRNLGLY